MIEDILQKQKSWLAEGLGEKWIERGILGWAKKQLKHDLVKVITGPRRVGKSVLGWQMLGKKKYGYLNFDEPNINWKEVRASEITQMVDKVYGKQVYILFDEIQNFSGWEVYVNKLQREGRNVIVTGSNAKLLSKELATSLTGRAIEIRVLPFSFGEARMVNEKIKVKEYLTDGYYPEVLVKRVEPELYYQALFDQTILEDVVVRYGLRNSLDLMNLTKYVMANVTCPYSFRSVAKKCDLTVPMTIDYLEKITETYLFYQLPKYVTKQAGVNRSDKKIYLADFAMARFNSMRLMDYMGQSLENAVFVELLRQGYRVGRTLFYGQWGEGEVDFVVIERDLSVSLYQVCLSVEDKKVKDREINGMVVAEKNVRAKIKNKKIITLDNEGIEGDVVISTYDKFVL